MADKVKILITGSFHRFVPQPGRPELRDSYTAGQTRDVSVEDARLFIAHGNATLADGATLPDDEQKQLTPPATEPAPEVVTVTTKKK